MASPVDAGRATTNITATADPWTVNLPGTISAGDLLLAWVRVGSGSPTVGPGGTWAVLLSESPDASDDQNEVWGKVATGTEGATISWDQSSAVKGAVIVWRITGVDTSKGSVAGANTPFGAEFSSATTTTGANINPASFTPSSPGGSLDYLWLSLIGMDSETGTASNGTLSNVASANSGTGGAVATNCIIWGGSIASTASSIDIAAWTSSAPNSGASAYTLAIYPPAATATSYMLPNSNLRLTRSRPQRPLR